MVAPQNRRHLLQVALATGAAIAIPVVRTEAAAPNRPAKPAKVNAIEDLMREHGVLRRVLLVYDESVRRLSAGNTPVEVIASAANIVKRFIEGYHEKLEEQLVFPRMQKAGKLTDLVQILFTQHQAGRRVTAEVLKSATAAGVADSSGREALLSKLQSFSRMYRPHAAREDTDLFPAYHGLFTENELDRLGDEFEEQERKLLGSGGFEGAVREVADLEKALGIHDLAQLTPR